RKGHFKGMLFDHVIKNFVIQGGNSQKLEVAGDWILKGKAHSQLATSWKFYCYRLFAWAHVFSFSGILFPRKLRKSTLMNIIDPNHPWELSTLHSSGKFELV
ncbi:hypothetical protein BHM03_00030869, partial [Ensete ventricosum]